jgi:putative Mg2+ transporter-C (MgtC) family protein
MTVSIGWPEIALRLALAVVAGGLLGINRTERGMSAGMRTILLVCLAAAVTMIQVNLLLDTKGQAPDSFMKLDPMRLPLGILTGMGFIGGGAILRRGDTVAGVTTAATLWLATVLGLCFGAGLHGLGLAALALGVVVLWSLKGLELRINQDRRATLTLKVADDGPTDDEIRSGLRTAGCRAGSWDVAYTRRAGSRGRTIRAEVHWRGRVTDVEAPAFVRGLAERPGVKALRWKA